MRSNSKVLDLEILPALNQNGIKSLFKFGMRIKFIWTVPYTGQKCLVESSGVMWHAGQIARKD
jgi:hypothetical protein